MAFDLTPEDQRRLLETSFEPYGEGFLFYRHRWSKGIPVSLAERDAYLAIPVFGSRRAFYREIKNRTPVRGQRDYDSAARRMANAFPKGMGATILLLGVGLLLRGIFADADFERWAASLGGLAGVLFGIWIIFYRRGQRP